MAVEETCPVCRTAEVVCGKWTLLLVRDLADGCSRFCELERSLAGISPRTLSLRLRALEEEGIVERHTFGEVPPRVEYALTEKGRALLPIVDGMRSYGEEWLGEGRSTAAVERSLGRVASLGLQDRLRASPSRSAEAGPKCAEDAFTPARDSAQGVRGGGGRPSAGGDRRRRGGPLRARRETGASWRERRAAVLLPRADGRVHRASARRSSRACPPTPQATSLLVDFDGLDRYLVGMGAGADLGRMKAYARAGAALRLLLEDVFEEQTDFDRRSAPPSTRSMSRKPWRGSSSPTGASASEMTLLATLHGLTIASEELALTKGLTIAQPGALRGARRCAPPARGRRRSASPDRGCSPQRIASTPTRTRRAVARGREVLKDLLRALRLFGDGRVTLGALAWARVGAGSWNPVALGAGGRPHGMLVVSAEQEDELRAFCSLVSRRAPHGNELAWALRRFELGCERASAYEALSDHLLALRGAARAGGTGERPAGGSDRGAVRDAGRPREADRAA